MIRGWLFCVNPTYGERRSQLIKTASIATVAVAGKIASLTTVIVPRLMFAWAITTVPATAYINHIRNVERGITLKKTISDFNSHCKVVAGFSHSSMVVHEIGVIAIHAESIAHPINAIAAFLDSCFDLR